MLARHLLKYSIGIVLFCLTLSISGQKYFVSSYTIADGLPTEVINDIFLDQNNIAWLATDAGLVQFNGEHFETNERGISSNYLRSFCAIDSFSWWVSHDAGISELNAETGDLQINNVYESRLKSQEDGFYFPNKLYRDNSDIIWISQPDGRIAQYVNGKIKFTRLEEKTSEDSESGFEFLDIPNYGFYILSSSGSLFLYLKEQDKFQKLITFQGVSKLISKGNLLFLGGRKLSVYRISAQRPFLRLLYDKELTDYTISCFTKDNFGNIFFGTDGSGVYQLYEYSNRIQTQKVYSNNDPHRIDELPFYFINKVFVDKDNHLWICSQEGLGILQNRFFESAYNLPNGNAITIASTSGNDVYVNFGDIFRVRNFGSYDQAEPLTIPFKGNITAIAADNSVLWAGTSKGELLAINAEGSVLVNDDFSWRGEGIFYVFADSKGRKWFCQAPEENPIIGLGCYNAGGKYIDYNGTKGFGNRMLVIRESPRGELYAAGIGPTTYLYVYIEDEDRFVNLSIPFHFDISENFEVHDLSIDDDDVVWLATTDGLMRYDMERITKINIRAPFDRAEIRSVFAEKPNKLWISTDVFGVLLLEDGNILDFGEESGLPSKIMSYRCIEQDNKGRLWIGTAEGAVFSKKDNPEAELSQSPIIPSFLVNGKHKEKGENHFLRLNENDELQLSFVSVAYPGELTKYEYRLFADSTDSSWISLNHLNQLSLSNVDPATQRIELRARQSGGFAWSKPTEFPVRVSKLWFKSGYFIASLAVAFGALIYFLLKYSNRFYRLKIGKLQEHIRSTRKLDRETSRNIIADPEHELVSDKSIDGKEYLNQIYLLDRLITKVLPGTKWELAEDHIANAILQIYGVETCEIGVLDSRRKSILLESFDKNDVAYEEREIEYKPTNSVISRSLKFDKTIVYSSNGKEPLFNPPTKREIPFPAHSFMIVPFDLNKRQRAVICAYSSKHGVFGELAVETVKIICRYIENVY